MLTILCVNMLLCIVSLTVGRAVEVHGGNPRAFYTFSAASSIVIIDLLVILAGMWIGGVKL